jgi:hypothetical protein
MKSFNNVCYCKCHAETMKQCVKCKTLHIAKELPVTHKADKYNPNLPEKEV